MPFSCYLLSNFSRSSPKKTLVLTAKSCPTALPNETLEHIFSYLSEAPTPALAITSRVCRRFRAVVKSNPGFNTAVSRKNRNQQLYCAELIYPYLFPKGFLPCYSCNKLFDSDKYEFNFEDYGIYNGKGLGGIRAKSRRCLECKYFPRLKTRPQNGQHPAEARIFGASRTKCDKCRNWIITLGDNTSSLNCADHAEWRARLLHERQMIACAYSKKQVRQLPHSLAENDWIWRQQWKARARPEKHARIQRPKKTDQDPDTDTILEEVSC